MPTTLINLNSTTPPAPGGGLNVIFQNDSSNPINVSAYVVLSSIVVTPAGSDTDVQVNSGGSLYADSGFTYNHTTGLVNITRTIFVGPPDSSFSTFEGGAPAYFGVNAAACANRISALNTADAGMANAFAVIHQEDLASATYFSASSSEAWTTNAGTVTINDPVFPGSIVGLSAGAHHLGAGNLAGTNNGPVGLYCTATLETTAHVSTITSAVFDTGNGGAGTIDLATAIWIPSIGDPGGTITKAVGIYIAPQVAGAVTTWAIYVDGTTPSFFGGNITVGTTNPATSGAINLENNQLIAWRNAGNSANLTAGYNTDDIFVVGNLSAGNITGGSVLSTGTITYYGINQTADNTYAVASAANAVGATTTYTGTFSNAGNLVFAGGIVKISGFSNSSNNGFFYVVSTSGGLAPTTVTVNNSGGIAESTSATLQTWAFYSDRSGDPGAIQGLGATSSTVTINSVAKPVSILAAPTAGQLGLVLVRENDPLDMTVLDTFLTDQNNRGFQITAITDGSGSTAYALQIGLVGGTAGAFFNCNVQTPALVLTAATPTTTTGQLGIGTTAGVGNGTPGAVLAPAIGTGSGPATPGIIVNWLEIDIAGTKYWIPLAQ